MPLLRQVKEQGQDFEWYPTTNEQINVVKSALKDIYPYEKFSLLDIGAGNGKVLDALGVKGSGQANKLFAIEKSLPLIKSLDKNIVLMGTDFEQQSLMDKKVDTIFCNPPYSVFPEWAEKIIKESNAENVFLILPVRWKMNDRINEALKLRLGKQVQDKVKILGTFDYLNAEDRKARAKVDVVHISISRYGSNPFDVWFDEHFASLQGKPEESELKKFRESKAQAVEAGKEVVIGGDLAEVLVALYRKDMDNLMSNYRALSTLDASLLEALDVNVRSVKEAIKEKIAGLKNSYWYELFENMVKVTSKLTYKSRQEVMRKLMAHNSVDFTLNNIYAVLVYLFKNVADYFDKQLEETYEELISEANVKTYKSNAKIFSEYKWRYRYDWEGHSHYGLETRLIVERSQALQTTWSGQATGELTASASALIDDLVTIANNLGFRSDYRTSNDWWEARKKYNIYYSDINGNEQILMEVKAFLNGNLHIKLASKFALALNVEFGRIKGWLNNAEQASDELGEKVEDVAVYFGKNFSLANSQNANLAFFG